jgi:cell division protein DivIC
MKITGYIPSFLRNKFLLAGTGFLVWMLFFDNDNFLVQMERRRELQEQRAGVEYYRKMITEDRQFTKDITTNLATIEKHAREELKMKRDNEDLFIIQKPEKE